MDKVIERIDCCGCCACINVCPKGALYIKEDIKGFKYPEIDKNKCINCGMCKKVCPVLSSKEEEKIIDAYACYNNNLDERLNSSSGGIFCLLAKEIIKRKGVVFGAVFDNEFNLRHSFIEKIDDLRKMQGSKYTQSIIGDSYKKAKEFLDNGRPVLFTGTPCQIEGLKSFLLKDYDNLYTQDIICHGVPSPRVLQKYINYQEMINKEKIESLLFRNKDRGWSNYETKIIFKTKIYNKNHSKDIFMRSFLKNICLRDSCYNCAFKKKYRSSDITLADYWGIENVHPEMDDDKGVSLVLVNSSKGNKLFNYIKKDITFKKTDIDKAISYNSAIYKSAEHCANENDFINNIDNMMFDELVKKYVPKKSNVELFADKLKNFIKRIIKTFRK